MRLWSCLSPGAVYPVPLFYVVELEDVISSYVGRRAVQTMQTPTNPQQRQPGPSKPTSSRRDTHRQTKIGQDWTDQIPSKSGALQGRTEL